MARSRHLPRRLAQVIGPFPVASRTVQGRTYAVWVLGDRAACNCLGARTGWARRCYHERMMVEMTQTTQALALRDEDAIALTPVQVTKPRSLVPHPTDLQTYVLIARNAPGAAGFALPKGVNHPAKAFAIMLAGYELGIGPMTAMRHIAAINGRTEPDAQLMMGICQANDPTCRFTWKELTAEKATVEIVRQGEVRGEFTYSLEDAKRAGQYDPDNPPMRPKVASWREVNGRNIPQYAKDDQGNTVMEPAPDTYWATHPQLALAYNAVRLGMKLTCADLVNNVLAAMMGGDAMVQAVEMGEAPRDAWDQIPDIDTPGDFASVRPQGAQNGRGWGESTPRQSQSRPAASRPPGGPQGASRGGSKTAAQWNQELADAMAQFQVAPDAVATIVGGANIGDVIRYLSQNDLDLAGLMERAQILEETGEVPGTNTTEEDA